MIVKDKLKRLVDKYIGYEENADLDYYFGDYLPFKRLFDNALIKSPFKNLNAKIVIDNLDMVLKYTNMNNMDWLTYDSLLKQPNYLEKLMDNLESFRFPEHITDLLIIHLYNRLDVDSEDRKNFFSDKLMDYVTKLGLSTYDYSIFFMKMDSDTQYRFIQYFIKNNTPLDYISYELYDICEEFICDNIIEFASNSRNLYSLRRSIYNNDIACNKINNYINEHSDQAFDSIFNSLKIEIKEEDTKDLIRLIIMDIVNNEKASLSDISIDSGNYSTVLLLKDKVIKLGYRRATASFPDNPYIVRPLLRKTLDLGEKALFIEITERVKDDCNATHEEMYSIYSKLRDLGLIWTDVAPRNVGVLLKDNIVYWDGRLNLDSKSLELDEYRGNDLLKKGDIVILDADHIYDENSEDIYYPAPRIVREFEERYEKKTIYDSDTFISKGLRKHFKKY